MKKYQILGVVLLVIVSVAVFLYFEKFDPLTAEKDFKDVKFEIEGEWIGLSSGSGSGYFGNEVFADVNSDGFEDIVFLLTRDGGGSGTFYYAAAALGGAEGFSGTNAIFLGDRIAPQNTRFSNGIISVNYATRGENEPMTTRPSFGMTKYLVLSEGKLSEIALEKGEELISGKIVMGHEVRSFKSCSGGYEYWVMGNSPAYSEMLSAYKEFSSSETNPYAPMFGVLIGKIVPAPDDGFGADYENAISVREAVILSESMNCK